VTADVDPALLLARKRLTETLGLRVEERAPSVMEPLFRKALTVPDRKMRALALVQRLRRYDVRLCYVLLHELVLRATRKNHAAQEVLLDLTTARPLIDAVGYHKARRIYELASERGRRDVARMLLSPETMSAREVDSSFLAKQNEKLPDESLGWRKKLARGFDRMKLDRLLFDRHPQVVRLLLDNPRIIERDVIRIAAMRPTNPKNLAEVFRHSRWVRRYRVKVALACNPFTPIDIALSCVPHMMRQNLEYIASSGKIHDSVRDAARQLLEVRAQPMAEEVIFVDERGEPVREPEEPDAELDAWLDEATEALEEWQAGSR
jgi:hypothetical protein